MMKVNDFLRYDIKLKIDYDDYFRLIYETKYLIEARLGPNRTFIATKAVYGNSRKKAVQQAVQWFWKDFKGILGSAHKIMTISDPYEEVSYDDNFACNDLGNKYLDEETLSNLIDEANGDLARDESEGSEGILPQVGQQKAVKAGRRPQRRRNGTGEGVLETDGPWRPRGSILRIHQ